MGADDEQVFRLGWQQEINATLRADSLMQGLLTGWAGLRRIVKIPGLARAASLSHL